MARRQLGDGREFHVVKVFWDAEELQARLGQLSWDVTVRPVGEEFLFGTATAS